MLLTVTDDHWLQQLKTVRRTLRQICVCMYAWDNMSMCARTCACESMCVHVRLCACMQNAYRRSRVGVGMNRSVREGKTCKAL